MLGDIIEHFTLVQLVVNVGNVRLVPSQDVPYAIIIWYVSKIIYLS